MVNEVNIAAALADLSLQDVSKFNATAKKHKVDRKTLTRHYKCQTISQVEAISQHHKKLTRGQESVLVDEINCLCTVGFPPKHTAVASFAYWISGAPIGQNWVTRFVARHRDELKSVFLKSIDRKRQIAENVDNLEEWYSILAEKIEKYNIESHNIYNMDEKGFLIGQLHTEKRIVNIDILNERYLLGVGQDGSCEFITLLATICVDGTALSLALIYKAESGDMQASWIKDFDHNIDNTYFSTLYNGWSNDAYAMEWIQKIFNTHIRKKAGRGYCLLILDGHASYLNWEFIEFAQCEKIILARLSAHCTHRMQSFDVGIFSPLAKKYSNELNIFIQNTLGFYSFKKIDFWYLFNISWKGALTEQNILSAFEATGIHPFNSERVLKKLRKSEIKSIFLASSTPSHPISLRKLIQVAEKGSYFLGPDVRQAFRAVLNVATGQEFMKIRLEDLYESKNRAKAHKKEGKAAADLLDQNKKNDVQFFSPERVKSVREAREAAEILKQQEEDLRKQKQVERDFQKTQAADDQIQCQLARKQAQKKQKKIKKIEMKAKQARQAAVKILREQKRAKVVAKKMKTAEQRAVKKQMNSSTQKSQNKQASTSNKNVQILTSFTEYSNKVLTNESFYNVTSLASQSAVEASPPATSCPPQRTRCGRSVRAPAWARD